MLNQSNVEANVVCLLDNNRSTLRASSQVLESAGWKVEPFTQWDAFIEYARIYHPRAAVVDYGGTHAIGLEVADQLRRVFPATFLVISREVHRGRVHEMLSENELVNLINRNALGRSAEIGQRQVSRSTEEACYDHCP